MRICVLDTHKLKPSDFPDMEQALAAADKLIAFQRTMIVGVEEQHPDIIVGDPMLDQLWYAKHQGIRGIVGWIEVLGEWESGGLHMSELHS